MYGALAKHMHSIGLLPATASVRMSYTDLIQRVSSFKSPEWYHKLQVAKQSDDSSLKHYGYNGTLYFEIQMHHYCTKSTFLLLLGSLNTAIGGLSLDYYSS